MASQLQAANLMNGELTNISDPKRPWSEKVQSLAGVIDRHDQDIVLLCDEPTYWYQGQDPLLDDTPDNAARSLAERLSGQVTCRRIVSGRIPGNVEPLAQTKAPRIDDGLEFLDDDSQWAQTATLARQFRQALDRPLAFYTLWQIKLLVALSRFKSPREVARQALSNNAATVLLEELFDLLERDPTAESICHSLARLALARTPVARGTFEALTQGISVEDRSLVEICLCEQVDAELSLHPLVRQNVLTRARDPRRWETSNIWRLPHQDRQAVHQTLHGVYVNGATSLRGEHESLHHELLSGASALAPSDGRLRFVEQLHEIGRTLSYVHHDHAKAVDVFRFALELDSSVAYSHHYLAFNLDWLASEAEQVELHYREAVRLQSNHPWWWSRWICYLATRGRFPEAREAWREASDELSLGRDDPARWLYLSLHRWVARWLLHWSELDFAEDVLRSIPADVADSDMSIQTLRDLLEALRTAERGNTVFPLSVPARDWTSPAPHTDLPGQVDGKSLREWLPARIDSLDPETDQLFLLVGRRTDKPDAPFAYEEMELSKTELESAAIGFRWHQLSDGRFLELGYYGDERTLRIGLHKTTTWRNSHLLPLVPPPNRWYERAVTESWAECEGE